MTTSPPTDKEPMLARLFRYKAWANAAALRAVASIDPEAFPGQRRKAIRLLNHTHVVDLMFAARLRGEQHAYTATNTDDTPAIEALEQSIHDCDQWYVAYTQSLPDDRADETIAFQFADGKHGRMTRAEMLGHLIAHGAYHRGAVGSLLAELSLPRPADTFTAYLHEAEPERRRPATAMEPTHE